MTATSLAQLEFPERAAIRFGYGLSPRFSPPADAEALLDALQGPDIPAGRWPAIQPGEAERLRRQYRDTRQNRTQDEAAYRAAIAALNDMQVRGIVVRFARILDAPIPFRERLHWFWTDHFTTVNRQREEVGVQLDHHDLAIRPHITGRFTDMLQSAILHPAMLGYLDQNQSRGPTSAIALKKGGGVNENLAREVLELHTIGVGGTYSQDDVRQFALLLTGLGSNKNGLYFRENIAEPGAETVLGKTYGGGEASINDIRAALVDLARRPDTALHLARKLAVHFIDDDPDPTLIADMARAYRENDTALLPVYRVMVLHPAAQVNVGAKARQPFEWMATALRGMGLEGEAMTGLSHSIVRRTITDPLRRMGQPWHSPIGADGWAEEQAAWLTAPGLAERITWAMTAPSRLCPDLPDPRDLARRIIPGLRGEVVADLVFRAERRSDGLALVLASPELNTR